MTKRRKSTFTLGGWNIDGFHKCENRKQLNKLDDSDVYNVISSVDIAMLIETHCGYSDNFHFPGYSVYNKIRPKSHRAKKFSGGISVLAKNDIRPGVTYIYIYTIYKFWIFMVEIMSIFVPFALWLICSCCVYLSWKFTLFWTGQDMFSNLSSQILLNIARQANVWSLVTLMAEHPLNLISAQMMKNCQDSCQMMALTISMMISLVTIKTLALLTIMGNISSISVSVLA